MKKGFGGWARTLSGVAGVRSEDDSIEGPLGRFSAASFALGAPRRGGDAGMISDENFRLQNQFSKIHEQKRHVWDAYIRHRCTGTCG